MHEKRLFAEALTCKAKIVDIGSYDNGIIAKKLLEQALKLVPEFKKALDFNVKY
jgi:SAM-dependent MidA family methyltransferase